MLENKLNIDNYLQTIIPDIIEAFVDFYGENERDRIAKKFSHIVAIGYLSLKDYQNVLYDAKTEIKNLAMKRFFELIKVDYDEALAKVLFGTVSSIEIGPLYDYYTNRNKDYFNSLITAFVKKIVICYQNQGKKISEEQVCQLLDSYKLAYQEAVIYEEKLYDEKYGKYQEYFDRITKIKEDINKKYYLLYLKEIMPYLSLNDQQKITNMDIDNYLLYTFEDGGLYLSFVADISHIIKMTVFTSESEMMLHDANASDWQKESIIHDRIEYFRKKGFDYGDDYEAYLADTECQKVIPRAEFADKICSLKTSLEHQAIEEFFLAMPHIANAKKRVEKTNLIIKEGEFLSSIIKGLTCITPNYKLENGELHPYPLVHINGNRDTESFDCTLIHEFNHVFELSLIDYDDKMIHSVSGWDICNDEIKEKEEVSHENDEGKRPYEMLNEVINELLSQEICTLMHKKGKFFFGDSQTSVNTSRSSYSSLFCLAKDFYFEFKDAIIASRKDGHIEAIYNAVGKDNFEDLNLLCYDYEMYFGGMKIYSLYYALEKNVDNDITRFHKECLQKKDEILERMRTFSKEREKSV